MIDYRRRTPLQNVFARPVSKALTDAENAYFTRKACKEVHKKVRHEMANPNVGYRLPESAKIMAARLIASADKAIAAKKAEADRRFARRTKRYN